MKRFSVGVAAVLCAILPVVVTAATTASPTAKAMAKLEWRSIGPYIGGRVVAVAGVPSKPNLFYMGGVQGGVWKSDRLRPELDEHHRRQDSRHRRADRRASPWRRRIRRSSTPEPARADIRGDFDTGDGIYKTTDAGKTWRTPGLRDTHMTIARSSIDPRNPNVVYAALDGPRLRPNRRARRLQDDRRRQDLEQGALRRREHRRRSTSSMDARNPNMLYAAMWQAQRAPWKLTSGGPGSGALQDDRRRRALDEDLDQSRDSRPALLGKIGDRVAQSESEHRLRDRAGAKKAASSARTTAAATWKRVNAEMETASARVLLHGDLRRSRRIPKVAYVPNVDGVYNTTDGGKTLDSASTPPHGDNHIVWINPNNIRRSCSRATTAARRFRSTAARRGARELNQPTGQFYHVALDDQFPFHVYGAQQDEGAFEGAERIGRRLGDRSIGTPVALGESTFVAPRSGRSERHLRQRLLTARSCGSTRDRRREERQPVAALSWPARRPANTKYRFGWTHPILFSPANPKELLVAAQVVLQEQRPRRDVEKSSAPISRATIQAPKGRAAARSTSIKPAPRRSPTSASLAVSPLDADVMWAGSADGLVHVTKDHGANWNAVTPPATAAVGADQLDRAVAHR